MENSNSNKICKVAFVGAGYMAAEHIKAFRDIPNVRLAGICSRSAERAGNMAKELCVETTCRSIAELHERTSAELVVIAVPEMAVRRVAGDCFQYPWTCLIEKPAGYDVADAETISELARATNRRAFVALNRRHYSSTRAVFEDLSSDPAPRFIHVQDQEDLIAAAKAGQPKLILDNWMYANSIHLIDYFAMFGRGDVTEVQRVFAWNPASPGIVAAKVAFSSGDVGLYQAVWNAPGPWSVAVTTQTKRWELRPLEQAAFQRYGERKLEPVHPHEWDQRFKPGLRRQAELAVKAALGAKAVGLPTLEDALRSMRIAQSIYRT
ncbi:MAG: gfo/Idh/MocA family oxidoreductase [Betaproteobacteria bacterium]|nr:gfo/Idh/MocA family oxidoreductase [Betaproteobacteria bacterium]